MGYLLPCACPAGIESVPSSRFLNGVGNLFPRPWQVETASIALVHIEPYSPS